jgi:TonB family protein
MVSSITTTGLQGISSSLTEALGDFAGGIITLNQVHRVLNDELVTNPDSGKAIQKALLQERVAERLSAKDYGQLISSVDASLAADISTESAADKPDPSGFFHVHQEGTLVVEEDKEAVAPLVPTEAYDSLAEPPDKTLLMQLVVETPKLELGTVLCDRYQLDAEIASGSMGIVYRATDLVKKSEGAKGYLVAIKVIDPKVVSHDVALKTFKNEIANAQLLSHQNIIHMYEMDNEGDYYFITMEWLEGESLDALLDRSQGSALPPTQTYAIIGQLCDALAYAHERDVVHADVKPGNVFLVNTGELKLIDFGIAHAPVTTEENGQSGVGVALTPAYASCECLERKTPTEQDDLYSLACMIYRLLAGRRVFGALHALDAEKSGMEPVRIGSMTDDRWDALSRALSFRRADRQSSINEFAGDFGQRAEPSEPEPEEQDHSETVILSEFSDELFANVLADNEAEDVSDLSDAERLRALVASDALQNAVKQAPQAAAASADLGQSDLERAAVAGLDDSVSDFDKPVKIDAGLAENSEETLGSETAIVPDVAIDSLPGAFDADIKEASATAISPFDADDTKVQTDLGPFGGADATVAIDTMQAAKLAANPEAVPTSQPRKMTVENNVMQVDTVLLKELDNTKKLESIFGTPMVPPEKPQGAGKSDTGQEISATQVDKPAAVPAADATAESKMSLVNTVITDKPPPLGGSPDRDIPASGTGAEPPASEAVDAPAAQPAKPAAAETSESGDIEATASTKSLERLALQLGGGSQTQIVRSARNPTLQAIISMARKNRTVAGGVILTLLGIVAGAGYLLSTINAVDTRPVKARQAAASAANQQESVQASIGAPILPTELIDSEAGVVTPVVQKPGDTVTEVAQPVVVGDLVEVAAAPVIVVESLPLATTQELEFADVSQVSDPLASKDSVPAATPARIAELEASAEQALASGRLVEPADDSVAYWLGHMRTEGVLVPAVAVEAGLIAALIKRAENAYIDGNVDAARHWSDVAEIYNASEDLLAPVRVSIARSERQAAAAAVAAKKAEERAAREAVEAAKNAAVSMPTLPLSSLEFVRYEEAKYPTEDSAKSMSGWVDISFTVGTDGIPVNIKIINSDLPDIFEQPSIDAVQSWRFMPHFSDNIPVPAKSAVRLRYSR